MAEAKDNASGGGDDRRAVTNALRRAWPVPTLIVAGALFAGGVGYAVATRPRADPADPFRDAAALFASGEYEAALGVLNTRGLAAVEAGAVTPESKREFYRLRGETVALAQETLGITREENHRAVVKDYEEAERLGLKLSARDTCRLGLSLLTLGDAEGAAARAKGLATARDRSERGGAGEGEEDARPWRLRLVRAVVDRSLTAAGPPGPGGSAKPAHLPDSTLMLIDDLLAEPGLAGPERAWAVGKQCEIQLAAGHADEAVTRLLREIQQLPEGSSRERGGLLVLLGRAYLGNGEAGNAARQFEAAEELLERSDAARAQAELLLGRIRQGGGRLEEAREKFASVLTEHPKSAGAYAAAGLGLAQVEGALGNDEAALEAFRAVIADLPRAAPGTVTAEELRVSLMTLHGDRAAEGNWSGALPFAQLAASLFAFERTPPDVLLALGETHRRIADAVLEEARGGRRDLYWLDGIGPVTRDEAKRHSLAAGEHFRRHARSVQGGNPEAYAGSLWEAADSFDRAGAPDEALAAFGEYKDGATDADPRRAEARFRLAQILQSRGEYASAIAMYRAVAGSGDAGGAGAGGGGGHESSDRAGGSGPWAGRSAVPLAQCYLRDADPANDTAAEELLVGAVAGGGIAPDAREFRAALIELGRLYYETGRYPEAVARLTEVLERYPEDPGSDSTRFKLADSYRLSAEQIDRSLAEAMPLPQRQALEAARGDRRRLAAGLYEEVRRSLEGKDGARLTDLEKIQLRNSYFYLGDCAYDLKDFQGAIGAYDTARQKYPADPASLVAMVQIVNAYAAQGQWARALTANNRAKQHLARMPRSAWESPDLPMERKHWERWLESTNGLEQQAAAAR